MEGNVWTHQVKGACRGVQGEGWGQRGPVLRGIGESPLQAEGAGNKTQSLGLDPQQERKEGGRKEKELAQ